MPSYATLSKGRGYCYFIQDNSINDNDRHSKEND